MVSGNLAGWLSDRAWCDWHHLVHRHGHSGGVSPDPAVDIFVMTVLGIAILGSLVSLTAGPLVVLITSKVRHLFWALPAANVLLYAIAIAVRPYPGGFLAQFEGPGLVFTGVEVALVLAGSIVWAAVLGAVGLALRAAVSRLASRRADRPAAPPDETVREAGSLEAWRDGLPAASRWEALREGFTTPRHGYGYLVKHPGLWSYAVLPVVLNLLISALAFAVLLLAVVGFVTRLHPLFPPGWGWLLLEVLAGMAILLVAVLAAIVVWFVLQGVLCGHFFGKLAREVELQLGTPPEALKELPFWWQLADTLRDLAALILAHIGLLLLHVVPVLGSMASLAGSAYCDCYLFGREYLDLPLSLRGRTRRQRQAFARQFRGQTLGLGAAVLLMSAAPVIGPVLLTTAVVGAVLLHQRLASGKSQLPVGHA